MAEAGRISVATEVQLGALDVGLRQAEGMVSETTQKIGKLSSHLNPLEATGKKLLHVFLGFHAIPAAIDVVGASLRALKGDFDGVREALEKIPIAGSFVKAGGELREYIKEYMGIETEAKAIERTEYETKRDERRNEIMKKRGEILDGIVKKQEEASRKSEGGLRLVGLEGTDREIAENSNAIKETQERYRILTNEAIKAGLSEDQRAKAVDAINGSRRKEIDLLIATRGELERHRKIEKDMLDQEFIAITMEAEERRKQRDFDRENSRTERERMSRIRSFDVERSNNISELELGNKPLGAKRLEINQDIDTRLTGAFTDEERSQLERERGLRLHGLRTAGLPFLQGFLADQHTGIGAAREVVASRTAFGAIAHQDPLVKHAEKQVNILNQIERNTRKEQTRSILGADR